MLKHKVLNHATRVWIMRQQSNEFFLLISGELEGILSREAYETWRSSLCSKLDKKTHLAVVISPESLTFLPDKKFYMLVHTAICEITY